MSARSDGLPEYRNPPIDELAIGIQFPVIENFHDAHAGLYWRAVRTEYPKVENQPRIEGPIESGDNQSVQPVIIQFPLNMPSQGRTWLTSQHDDYLIQIQNTRFVQNWRKRGTDYPHFGEVWNIFRSHFDEFKDLLNSEGLAQPTIQQVEITYINWIGELPPSNFLKSGAAAGIHDRGEIFDPEDQALSMRYRLDGGGDIVERLYVQCQPAFRPQEPDAKGSALILIYRAANSAGLTDEQVKQYAELGHAVIVNAFTDLTTTEAHEFWGRE